VTVSGAAAASACPGTATSLAVYVVVRVGRTEKANDPLVVVLATVTVSVVAPSGLA
jgi:hypothetical protein